MLIRSKSRLRRPALRVATGALVAAVLVCPSLAAQASAIESPASSQSDASSESSAARVVDVLDSEFADLVAEAPQDTVETDAGLLIDSDDSTDSAPLTIPADPAVPIVVGADGVEVSLDSASALASASANSNVDSSGDGEVVGGLVVHPETHESTSTIVTAESEVGFEVYYLLDDASAPESFDTELALPDGARLSQLDSQHVDVVDPDGATLLSISAPWAYDTVGNVVPLTLAATGNKVTTKVPHRQGAFTYPILVDPTFTTHGDNVHISSTAPRAVSAHGWWIIESDCSCNDDADYRADITVEIQWYKPNVGWQTVEKKTTDNVKPGGGSSRRAAAREQCSGSNDLRSWRSIIDVDVRNAIDGGDKKTTPTVHIYCTP